MLNATFKKMKLKSLLKGVNIKNIILTRYHYILDEVLYSFQTALIKSSDLKEVLFWFGEIYHSGFVCKLWDFIFEFYYNYCAIIYPKYEKLFKKYFEDRENEYKNLLNIVVILFESNKSFDVFVNLNMENITVNIPKNENLIKWCKNINKKKILRLPFIKKFIISLHYKNYQNILSYLKLIKSTTDNDDDLNTKFKEIYILIIKYFTKYNNISVGCNEGNEGNEGNDYDSEYLFDIPYNDKIHILIALIHYMYRDECDINKDELEYNYIGNELYNQINTYLNDINDFNCSREYVLLEKTKYPINSKIGCFKLSRFNINYEELKNIYFNKWEFYSYFSPVWRERFDKYEIKLCYDNEKIIFNNEEDYEEFYDTFYYEFDEKSKNIQNRLIGKINKITPQDWLDLNNIPHILNV